MLQTVPGCHGPSDTLETQADRLAQFIEKHFPEEGACADLSDRKETVRLAIELLERLWRWEH